MESANTHPPSLKKSFWLILTAGFILSLLTLWTWNKWERVWIERSANFFPPEWQNEDLATLAWEYPLYRSNDSYQWVHLADALSEGNQTVLYHRFDEGLPSEGRPNRWHSGLAYLLESVGTRVAWIHDWPNKRGIHHSAHWLGAAIGLITLLTGTALILRLGGTLSAILFATLFFFNAAITWDFAFSRLDHEALFQCCFTLQVLSWIGLFRSANKQQKAYAALAGLSTAACFWIGATVAATTSALLILGACAFTHRLSQTEKSSNTALKTALKTWSLTGAVGILFFCLWQGQWIPQASIASIHPIFAIVLFGCGIILTAPWATKHRLLLTCIGFSLSLSPIVWILFYGEVAHPWLDPFMRRVHAHIIEFQSPFKNGLWLGAESIQASLIAIIALCSLRPSKNESWLIGNLLLGLVLLSLMQTRWLGLLATIATVQICIHVNQNKVLRIASLILCGVFASHWAWEWSQIEENPSTTFITDIMLQTGARDINLNLQRLSNGETIVAEMPYAFSATSALFKEVHPVGTFYWENREGLEHSANFFTQNNSEPIDIIDYTVVQGGRQGAPFAKLVHDIAFKGNDAQTIELSPVWQFSASQSGPIGWQEQPFTGTFPTEQFSVRVFCKE